MLFLAQRDTLPWNNILSGGAGGVQHYAKENSCVCVKWKRKGDLSQSVPRTFDGDCRCSCTSISVNMGRGGVVATFVLVPKDKPVRGRRAPGTFSKGSTLAPFPSTGICLNRPSSVPALFPHASQPSKSPKWRPVLVHQRRNHSLGNWGIRTTSFLVPGHGAPSMNGAFDE